MNITEGLEYDDNSELNSKNQPVYDWIPSNSGEQYRRFWIIENKPK